MSISSNKQVVLAFIEALARSDIAVATSLLADTFEFWVAGDPASFSYGGTKSRAQYTEMLDAFFPIFPEGFRLEVQGVTAEGERVAVEAEWVGKTARGKHYNNRYHLLFEVRNGKIQVAREYHDTLHAKEVLLDP